MKGRATVLALYERLHRVPVLLFRCWFSRDRDYARHTECSQVVSIDVDGKVLNQDRVSVIVVGAGDGKLSALKHATVQPQGVPSALERCKLRGGRGMTSIPFEQNSILDPFFISRVIERHFNAGFADQYAIEGLLSVRRRDGI